MNIVVCHNFYQRPGGEDEVFADEAALLESRGHHVVRYTLHNDAVNGTGGKAGRLVEREGSEAFGFDAKSSKAPAQPSRSSRATAIHRSLRRPCA